MADTIDRRELWLALNDAAELIDESKPKHPLLTTLRKLADDLESGAGLGRWPVRR